MKKNDEIIGIVSGYGSNGEGIIKHDGSVVFVPYVVKNEKVRVKILKVTSKCAYGKLIEVIVAAEDRIVPKCSVFSKCGGCQLQHLEYLSQIALKEENIKRCFEKIAGLNVNVLPTLRSPNVFGYRNKLQLPIAETEEGTVCGFYAENSHRVISINDCPINSVWTKKIINSVKLYAKEFNLKGYNYNDNCGDLREVVVKQVGDNLIITIVSTKNNLPCTDRLVDILKENISLKFSLFINVNKTTSNVVFGEEFYHIYGKSEYVSEMAGIKYPIGVRSFMQVNTDVCKLLYSKVFDLIDADEDTVVVDAYSGAGLMTALLSKNAKKAIGIEIVKEAVMCADDLASMNHLQNKIRNYNGKCEEILPDIISKETANGIKTRVVLDPPRKGCDLKVINALSECEVGKIVYVSCLPQSLARDVGLLVGSLKVENGEIRRVENFIPKYKIECIQPFDMFPQTKHIETLVVLSHKNRTDISA